jgi:RNA polymerase sigma-70 factor (ECF subfamily)
VGSIKKSKMAQLLSVFSVSSKEEDVLLMERLQADDLTAFETLYMKYRTPLYSYFLNHCGNTTVAEDWLQDCFAKLLEKRMSFRFESKFSTWLWMLARNQMIDHWRSGGHQLDQGKITSLETDDVMENLESPLSGPEEHVMAASDERALRACLEELPLAQKDAVLLRSHAELAYEDIALQLSTTVSAVKSLLVRAKEKLLDCLKRGGHA